MTAQKSMIPNSSCGLCGITQDLQRCSRCKAMFYCGREHQAADYPSHKNACSIISKRCSRLESEERSLRAVPRYPASFFPEDTDVFKDYAGSFWGILETREYMRARFALVDALKTIKTRYSVQVQLDHLMDMLRLCRSDNMGLRSIVPALLLRLNKDQECYDFSRWWRTIAQDPHYDWSDMDMPYLDTRGANAFEETDIFCNSWLDLSNTVAVTLLKIKILLDLRALQNSVIVGEKVPREILNSIQRHVVRSPIVASNRELMERSDHSADIETLEIQTEDLFDAVQMSNRYFWARLINPGPHLTARPETYSAGSVEEMQLVLQYSYDAWIETPGAIDVIRDLMFNNDLDADMFDLSFSSDEELQECDGCEACEACEAYDYGIADE